MYSEHHNTGSTAAKSISVMRPGCAFVPMEPRKANSVGRKPAHDCICLYCVFWFFVLFYYYIFKREESLLFLSGPRRFYLFPFSGMQNLFITGADRCHILLTSKPYRSQQSSAILYGKTYSECIFIFDGLFPSNILSWLSLKRNMTQQFSKKAPLCLCSNRAKIPATFVVSVVVVRIGASTDWQLNPYI